MLVVDLCLLVRGHTEDVRIIWSSSYHLTSDPAGFPCVQTEADFNRARPEPVLRCRGWTERPCLPIVYLLKLEAAADHL